jgi:MinD superfamily P-loop ATPase
VKEIVVLSGKGGTGKTTIVGSFAAMANSKVLADCDVDAADLHLLLQPDVAEEHEFWSGQVASIDPDRCTQCGICRDSCRFDAIRNFMVDALACEGCGLCYRLCPESAVSMNRCLSGRWFKSKTAYGPLLHARLDPGQENSGRLVAVVRQQARIIAHREGFEFIISDGPPGIGCPVISSLTGASLALLVTEPTPSGMHDLERVLGVCRHFGVWAAVCINKCDLDTENAGRIAELCEKESVPILGYIPFDEAVTEAISQGLPLVEFSEGPASCSVQDLWQRLRSQAILPV